MVTAVENRILTEVGPGTPMGQLMRRYWIPAAVSTELPEKGGAPVRVRLLGENLVAYRDPEGTPGLVQEYCPHRRASLAYARNEVGGLRCLYHGWKVGCAGKILEAPAESPQFTERLPRVGYPVKEMAGIIWTYMGPPDLEPEFPIYPWMKLAPPNLLVVKMYQDCNYLQGLEGDLDPAHPNFLHRDIDVPPSESWGAAGWNSIADMIVNGYPEIICEETPHFMHVGAIRKTKDPQLSYVRVAEMIAPFYAHIGSGPHEMRLFKAWHPIDDYSSFTFYIHYDYDKPVDAEAAHRNWGHRAAAPDFRTSHTNANMHEQTRAMMAKNFSGVAGAAVQDRAVQESMGPIIDRSKEILGTSDKAVIFHRRLLLRKIREMEEGAPLPGLQPGLDQNIRAASCYMSADRPWQEAALAMEEQETSGKILGLK